MDSKHLLQRRPHQRPQKPAAERPTTCDLRIQLLEEIRIGRIVAPFA
jgi:hypothetical protein